MQTKTGDIFCSQICYTENFTANLDLVCNNNKLKLTVVHTIYNQAD